MKIAKRIFIFATVNIAIIATLSGLLSLLGGHTYLEAKGINYQSLIIFCLIWGFGGAFLSLAISRIMAKWMMGVQVLDPHSSNPEHRDLVRRVHGFAKQAGISTMPEVGIYEAEELNAFATGPTKNRALVAVSSGLLHNMNEKELDGVLAHEVAHIANGDMVTMTLVQGVVNAFVMFLARVIGFFISQFVAEDKRNFVQFGIVFVLEIVLGVLGMLVVAFVSRAREFRADRGGASLSSTESMIAALERLKANYLLPHAEEGPAAVASLKISGKNNNFVKNMN